MQVEMEYRLPCNRPIVLHHVHMLEAENLLHCPRDFCRKRKEPPCLLRVDFKNIRRVVLGQNQHMSLVCRETVQYRLKFLVFVYRCGRDLPCNDFTENTVAHSSRPFFCPS